MFSFSTLLASLPAYFSTKPAPSCSDAPPNPYHEADDVSQEMSQVHNKPHITPKSKQNLKRYPRSPPAHCAPPVLETLDENIAALNQTEICGDWTLNDARNFLFLKAPPYLLPRLRVPLYPFQLLGVAYLRKHEVGTLQRDEGSGMKGGAVLADEMGLGKTIQVLGAISLDKPDHKKKTLIVVPASLVHHWENEIKTKLIGYKVCVFHGPDKQKQMKEFNTADIVIRSYEGLREEWKTWKYKSEKDAIDPSASPGQKLNTASSPESPAGKGVARPLFYATTWFRIVLDEAQNIRNRATNTSRAVRDLKGDYKHAITGTLINNTLGDVYALCKFLEIPKLNDENTFDGFITYVEKEQPHMAAEFLRKHFIQKYFMRRKKETILEGKKLLELPPMVEETIWLALSSAEHIAYESISHEESLVGNPFNIPSWVLKSVSIWTKLLRQRQASIHPYLIQEPDDKGDPPQKPIPPTKLEVTNVDLDSAERTESCGICGEPDLCGKRSYISCSCTTKYCQTCIRETLLENEIRGERDIHSDIGVIRMKCVNCGKHLDTSTIDAATCTAEEEEDFTTCDLRGKFVPSTKLKKALSLLRAWGKDPKTACDKTLIISEFTSALDLMGMYLSMNDIPYLRYDGRMNAPQRADSVRDFMTKEKPDVLLLSRKAGGLGLNLTRANRVILLDPWWNLPVEDQAIPRCHRIGQTKPVYVYRLLMEDTIERDMVDKYQAPKRVLERAAYGEC